MAEIAEFQGPLLKVERANQHIAELEALFDKFLSQGDTHSFEEVMDGVYAQKVKKRLPEHLATIIGDAIHNVRASLDHLYVILTRLNGQTPDRYKYFPIHEDASYLASQLTPKNPNPSVKVMDVIRNDIRPHDGPNGTGLILAIHNMDIADKHVILLPIVGSVIIKKMAFLNKDGSVALTTVNESFGGYDPMRAFAGPFDMVVSGYKVVQEEQPSLTIVFGEDQPLASKGVIESLKAMSKVADDIIRTLAAVA